MKQHGKDDGRGRRRGSALVMAVLLFTSLLVLSYAFFQVVMSAGRQLDSGMDDQRAFYLAEAGMFEAVQAIRNGGTGAIASQNDPAYFGGGVFWATAEDIGGSRTRLVVTAMAGRGREALEVILRDERAKDSLFVATLNSKDLLTMNADVMVDSFQSSLGDYALQATNSTYGLTHANTNGHVRSNTDIVLNSRANVFGDAIPGPAGTVSLATDAHVTGSVIPSPDPFSFPPIDVPVFPPSGSFTASVGTPLITPGQYDFTSLTIPNNTTLTIQGPAEIVVDDFSGGKDGNLLIDATNGPVTIFVENSYTHVKGFEANAIPGSPMALAFMVTAPQNIVFPSDTNIRGAYYLPDSNILFSSGNECWGSFAANQIEMSNGMNFHFDEDLADYFKADTGQSSGQFSVLSWSETRVGPDAILRDRRDPLARLGLRKTDLRKPADAWVPAP